MLTHCFNAGSVKLSETQTLKGFKMFRGFFDRLAAGPQSAEQTTTYEGDVTITRTDDTSSPYPHYMHQPATSIGQTATPESYTEMTSQQQSPEAVSLAGRLMRSIRGDNA